VGGSAADGDMRWLCWFFTSAARATATEENYQKIKAGMRPSDVEALPGRPIGDRVAAVNYLFLCSSSGTLREEFAALRGLTMRCRGMIAVGA